jgi:hypothetical protein
VISWDRTTFGSTSRRTNFTKELNIGFVVICPLRWKVIFVINSFYWTNRFTGTTVNTLIRVDV